MEGRLSRFLADLDASSTDSSMFSKQVVLESRLDFREIEVGEG